MKKIFVSHSIGDLYAKETISFLKSHLAAYDFELQGAEDSFFYPGDDIKNVISEAINKCSIFLCFIEPGNPYVMFELGYALGKNKKIVIVGDAQEIPSDVKGMAYIRKHTSPYDILSFLENDLNYQERHTPLEELDPNLLQNNIRLLVENPDLLDTLDGKQFEELVRQWFVHKGFNLKQTSYSRDGGYDFHIAPFEGRSAIVEVKKYKATSKVPVSTVRQLVGAMALERVPFGIVVSSAPFTNSAIYFAQEIEPKVLLWTLDDLIRLDGIPNNAINSDS